MKTNKRYVPAHKLEEMMKQRYTLAYYSCPANSQGTPKESDDVLLLNRMHYEVISSNTSYLKHQFEKLIEEKGVEHERAFDTIYGHIIEKCEVFFVRAEKDGTVSELRLKEIAIAKKAGIPILELPRAFKYRRKKNEFFSSQ